MPEVSNAKDATGDSMKKILVLGNAGVGKSTQILTLPRPTFVYIFDPNAIESLKGHDIDYLSFMPDRLPLNITSLKKNVGDPKRLNVNEYAAKVYNEFEEHAEDSLENGFFDKYNSIAFDSMTTMLDLIMDRVLAINNRPGEWPQQDDYGPQMNAFGNVVRRFTSQKKVLYFTGHIEMKQDDISKKVTWQPLMTGRLRVKIPLLFTDTFMATADTDRDGKTSYSFQTKPTREFPLCRTSIDNLKFLENVTMDMTQPLDDQGLGGLLKGDRTNIRYLNERGKTK